MRIFSASLARQEAQIAEAVPTILEDCPAAAVLPDASLASMHAFGRSLNFSEARVEALILNASVSHVKLGNSSLKITLRSDPEDRRTRSLLTREFRKDEYGLLQTASNTGGQMLDIGGHVGTTAIFYALLHPGAKVYSFEPAPVSYFYFVWNAWANSVPARSLSIFNFALSADGRPISFEYSPDDTTSAKDVRMGATWGSVAKVRSTVQTVKLDQLLRACRIDDVRFVKLDCEGCEFDLVPANERFFRENRVATIVGEFHQWRAWDKHVQRGGASIERSRIASTRDALCSRPRTSVRMKYLSCEGDAPVLPAASWTPPQPNATAAPLVVEATVDACDFPPCDDARPPANVVPPSNTRPSIRTNLTRELLQHVEPRYRPMCRAMLRGRGFSFAQAWQDWYLFWNLFSDRLTWGEGTYVDIGTNHPTRISNTLFFDKCLGWRGVCFEPQAQYHAAIRENRSCTLIPSCVVGSEAALGGHLRPRCHGSACDGSMKLVRSTDSDALRCVSARRVLPSLLGDLRKGVGNGRQAGKATIDLLTVDIEGMEGEVLRCFPFDEFNVRAVLIETNKAGNLRAVDRFFHRHDFVNVETFTSGSRQGDRPNAGWLDNLYVRRERKAVLPPWQNELTTSATDRHIYYRCSHASAEFRAQWCMPWYSWDPRPAVQQNHWTECAAATPREE